MSRSTKAKKTRANSDEWDEEGKLVYENIRLDLKEIPVSDWNEVWQEFWFVEQENHLSENRCKKIRRREREIMAEPAEEELGILFNDDKGDDVEGGDGRGRTSRQYVRMWAVEFVS